MDTKWKVPSDAILTIPEIEDIADLVQRWLDAEWRELQFTGSPPQVSTAVVRYVFRAMKDILIRQGRITSGSSRLANIGAFFKLLWMLVESWWLSRFGKSASG